MRDDDLEEREWPEDDDRDPDDLTAPCPHCDEDVYDDAERCPACGHYLTREDTTPSRPMWFVVSVLICLAVAMTWILGR